MNSRVSFVQVQCYYNTVIIVLLRTREQERTTELNYTKVCKCTANQLKYMQLDQNAQCYCSRSTTVNAWLICIKEIRSKSVKLPLGLDK